MQFMPPYGNCAEKMDERIRSLTKSVHDIDQCLERNGKYLANLEGYHAQAEEYSNRSRRDTSSLHPFGEHRAGKIPIPDNNHTIQREAFARRFLGPMQLRPEWGDWEVDALSAAMKRFGKGLSTDDIDWEEIATACSSVDRRFNRSAASCRIEYMNAIKVDSAPDWSSEEDDRLSRLVTEFKGTNWVEIGRQLDRTAFQCYSRCYSKLHPVLVPTDFTPEDDVLLTEVVGRIGERSWAQAAMELGTGHTDAQCMDRWTKTLKPGIRGGRWNTVLDAKLKAAVAIYGEGKWTLIAQHVEGKTDRKCRERYCEKFLPGLKPPNEWTVSEDEALVAAVATHGAGNWTKVKDDLPGRTDHMCRVRFSKIDNGPPELRQEYMDRLQAKRETKLARTRSAVSTPATPPSGEKRPRGRPRKEDQ